MTADPAPAPASAPDAKLSPSRTKSSSFLRRVGIFFGAILLLLLLAEVVLRLFVSHYDSHYLVPGKNDDGTPVWMDNPYFSYRFFPRRLATLSLPVRVPQRKPDGVLRVVLLGDTELLGDPDPSFGIGRLLEPVLQERFPSRRVEVLSLGLAGANSHVQREIARDLERLSPDAIVLACGNNEIAGPYGPASPSGRLHSSSRIARLLVLANRLCLRQAFAGFRARHFPVAEDTRAWRDTQPLTLRDRIGPGDARLGTAERSFVNNFRAILDAARDAAPVVVPCTLPVNLRDSAPFATAYLPDENDAQKVREALRAAIALDKAGQPDAAFAKLREALDLNPSHAEALFRAAKLADGLGQTADAAVLYRAAADADALPLRATSFFNDAIRDLARQVRIEPFDADLLFAESSSIGVPGNDFFWDHVHLTFEGRHLFVSELASRIAWEIDPAAAEAPVPTADELSGVLLYSPWGKRYEIDALLHSQLRSPCNLQITHADTLRLLRQSLAECDERLGALPGDVSHEVFARRQRRRPDDAWLSARAAYYLLQSGDLDRALDAAGATLRQWPHRVDAIALDAFVQAVRGVPAADLLPRLASGSGDFDYYDVVYAISIGKKLNEIQHFDAAEPWLRHALARDPCNSDASIALAQTLYGLHRNEDAVATLQAALERTPGNPLIWDELSVLYCLVGEWSLSDEAMRQSDRIAPYRYERLFKRAEALSRIRQYRRALGALGRYLDAVPDDPEALDLREFLLSKVPQPPPSDPSPASRKRMPWE